MTTLYVLGSGSRGNCCAVESEGAVVLIDAGFSAREIERRAAGVGLALDRVVAVVVTHEHGDHAAGVVPIASRRRAPVLTAPGTWAQLAPNAGRVRHVPLDLCTPATAGPFAVHACPTSHDAAEPLAVVVRTADGTGIGVAYDLGRPTAAVRYLLRDLNAIVLEANHDEALLRTSGYPASVQHRIAGAGGHLSNRAAAELLSGVHHPGLAVVVLAHLSQRCNTADQARDVVAPALQRAGFAGTLHIATQDEPLPPIAVPRRKQAQLPLTL